MENFDLGSDKTACNFLETTHWVWCRALRRGCHKFYCCDHRQHSSQIVALAICMPSFGTVCWVIFSPHELYIHPRGRYLWLVEKVNEIIIWWSPLILFAYGQTWYECLETPHLMGMPIAVTIVGTYNCIASPRALQIFITGTKKSCTFAFSHHVNSFLSCINNSNVESTMKNKQNTKCKIRNYCFSSIL